MTTAIFGEAAVQEQAAANTRRSWLLLAGCAGAVALVLAVLALLVGGGPVGVVVALVLGVLTAAGAYVAAEPVTLRLSRARPAPIEEFARYHNLVEGLCVASGLTKPRLFVVDDPAPNALVAGRDPRDAALVVTTGLLDSLDRMELEGVLAHELSQIKNHDVVVSTLAVTTVGGLVVLGDVLLRKRWWGMGRTTHEAFDREAGGAPGALAPLAAVGTALLWTSPLVARLLRSVVDPQRETQADVSGVAITRYPPGLIAGLERLEATSTVVHAMSHATAHLWIEEPAAQTPDEGRFTPVNNRFRVHPPTEERIALLREL